MDSTPEKDSEIRFKRIFEFFSKHYSKKTPFTMKELQEYAQFDNPETLETYFSKRLQDLVINNPSSPATFYVRDILNYIADMKYLEI